MEDPKDKTENTDTEEGKTAPPSSAQSKEAEAPEKEEPTFTKAQVDEEVHKARIKLGWTAKDLEKREKALTTREQAIAEQEAAKDAEELERFKDDPEKLDVVKERQKLRQDRQQLDKEKREHDAEIKAANEAKVEIACWEIAKEAGIDPTALKEAVTDLELKTEEQIKKQAKYMAGTGTKPPAPAKQPDSGRNMGGQTSDKTADEKLKAGFAKLNKK